MLLAGSDWMEMLPENPGIVETRRESCQISLTARLYIVARENDMDRVDLYMHAVHKGTYLPMFLDPPDLTFPLDYHRLVKSTLLLRPFRILWQSRWLTRVQRAVTASLKR
jgi:hypothetical protein